HPQDDPVPLPLPAARLAMSTRSLEPFGSGKSGDLARPFNGHAPALAPTGDPVETLDVPALARGLARSLPWIAGCALARLVVRLVAGLVSPNQYVSEGKIEVRLGERESRAPASALLPADDERPGPPPGIRDEIELLSNPAVYERVAVALGPARLLAP